MSYPYRRCHEKPSYVSNFALSFYCMNGSIEGRCSNYKNSSVCNSDFIARSVLLEFFKVMCLPLIDPFMQLSEQRIIWHIGFFVTTTIYRYHIHISISSRRKYRYDIDIDICKYHHPYSKSFSIIYTS